MKRILFVVLLLIVVVLCMLFIPNKKQDIAIPNDNIENEKEYNSQNKIEEPIKIMVDFDDENPERKDLDPKANNKIDEKTQDVNLQTEVINNHAENELPFEDLNPNETPVISD